MKLRRTRQFLTSTLLILSAGIIVFQASTFAVNQPPSPGDCVPGAGEGYNALQRGSTWHNICKPCGPEASDTGGADIDPSDPHVEAAFKFLISTPWKKGATQNWTAAQAAGMVGNFMRESGPKLDPKIRNSLGAVGIAQWLYGRKDRLFRVERNPETLAGQLHFVIVELNSTHTAARNKVHSASTPEEAATAFNRLFEVSGDYGGTREKYARSVYNKYKDLAPATDAISLGATGAPCSDTSAVNCGSEQGVAKILCAAKRYEGIYYRWGGGHDGVAHFHKVCPDPTNPPNNHPHGAPRDPANGGLSGNPSPCAVDCSGLVIQAVYDAFKADLGGGGVHLLMGNSKYWKQISLSETRPGDVVVPADLHHIEIVVKHLGGKRFDTFGAHRTGTKTGPATGSYAKAYHYVGPGGNTAL